MCAVLCERQREEAKGRKLTQSTSESERARVCLNGGKLERSGLSLGFPAEEAEAAMASMLPLRPLMLLFLAHLLMTATAQSTPLVVKGRVFCDACGAGHFAKSSFYLAGAKVGVQCGSGQAHGHVTAYAEGKTGPDGEFSIPVSGEHENDVCVALALHSAHPTCNLISHHSAFAAVYLTRHAGLADNIIHTGPFSFAPNRPAPSCAFEAASEDGNSGD